MKSIQKDALSLESCAGACGDAALVVAGVVDGAQCFCGTDADLATAKASASVVDKAECVGTPCGGDFQEPECGGKSKLLAYKFTCSTPPPPSPPAPPPPPPPCTSPRCFRFTPDWMTGGAATTLPTGNFSVRKLEAIHYPADGRTYAYVDIVNFSDPYYPSSYESEVGVYSSPDGLTRWQYHGIVIPRGPAGDWDSNGIASPGAAVAADGTVLVGYAACNNPAGRRIRGIGVAVAPHPLGPFRKLLTPIAAPDGICINATCDDVIMQSRPDGKIHLYHSVKGRKVPPGSGIRHRVTTDAGLSWSPSELVLSTTLQPGTTPAESILGGWFPELCGGRGGMVLVTDGSPAPAGEVHAYVSATPGNMSHFVPAAEQWITEHPPYGPTGSMTKGDWASAAGQIGFIPAANGAVVRVSYSLWTGVYVRGKYAMSMGYSHTVFNMSVSTPPPEQYLNKH